MATGVGQAEVVSLVERACVALCVAFEFYGSPSLEGQLELQIPRELAEPDDALVTLARRVLQRMQIGYVGVLGADRDRHLVIYRRKPEDRPVLLEDSLFRLVQDLAAWLQGGLPAAWLLTVDFPANTLRMVDKLQTYVNIRTGVRPGLRRLIRTGADPADA